MTSAPSQINKQNIEDIYPLSPMQQGMLFHSLYAPDSGIYFQQMICTLRGNLEVAAFEQAWQKIVEKHSIFRTAFIWKSLNKPVQVVYKQVKITVENDDWQGLSAQEQQEQLKFFLESDQQHSLQLSQPPLMRLHLIKLDKNTHQFVFSSKHYLSRFNYFFSRRNDYRICYDFNFSCVFVQNFKI